jgi:hypothetical protein
MGSLAWVSAGGVLQFLIATASWIGLEAKGVFISIAVAESFLAGVGVLVFRRGKWKLQVV